MIQTTINAGINVSGSGNVVLEGAFHGQDVITDTGTGSLTVEPIYNVATMADLVEAIQAIDGGNVYGVLGVN